MFRSYLIASLFLSVLLIFSGCAKKTMTAAEEPPAPVVTETASVPTETPSTTVVTESKPAAPQSVEALLNMEEKMLETVFFDYDSSDLTPGARQQLARNAEWLLGNPDVNASIEGHCDERGSDEYNLALGERRALSAKTYLAELGIAPERLAIISYGEERPAVSGHDEMAWEKNRRVEFK